MFHRGLLITQLTSPPRKATSEPARIGVDGKIANIEGDSRSPSNEGTLCPKGAAIYQRHVNPHRPTKVLHPAPGATDWEEGPLEKAMERVAELVKKTRDDTFIKSSTTSPPST